MIKVDGRHIEIKGRPFDIGKEFLVAFFALEKFSKKTFDSVAYAIVSTLEEYDEEDTKEDSKVEDVLDDKSMDELIDELNDLLDVLKGVKSNG